MTLESQEAMRVAAAAQGRVGEEFLLEHKDLELSSLIQTRDHSFSEEA